MCPMFELLVYKPIAKIQNPLKYSHLFIKHKVIEVMKVINQSLKLIVLKRDTAEEVYREGTPSPTLNSHYKKGKKFLSINESIISMGMPSKPENSFFRLRHY